jgi:hypothetical protein
METVFLTGYRAKRYASEEELFIGRTHCMSKLDKRPLEIQQRIFGPYGQLANSALRH